MGFIVLLDYYLLFDNVNYQNGFETDRFCRFWF